MLKVLVGYPTPTEEFVIVERMTGPLPDASQKVLSTDQPARDCSAQADSVYVDPALIEYAVRLVDGHPRRPRRTAWPSSSATSRSARARARRST